MKSSFRKRYLLFVLLPIFIFIIYWFKFQIGINVFTNFSIGNRFPFKYLKNDVIEPSGPTVLINEDFNVRKVFPTFLGLWMKEKETVNKEENSPNGFKGTNCLFIESNSSESWSYSHRKTIKVKQGDRFYMEGLIKMKGDRLLSYLSVVVFDKNKDVIHWGRFRSSTDRRGEWIKVTKEFVIVDPTVSYVKFRLTGKGVGTYLFDDIIFRKLN